MDSRPDDTMTSADVGRSSAAAVAAGDLDLSATLSADVSDVAGRLTSHSSDTILADGTSIPKTPDLFDLCGNSDLLTSCDSQELTGVALNDADDIMISSPLLRQAMEMIHVNSDSSQRTDSQTKNNQRTDSQTKNSQRTDSQTKISQRTDSHINQRTDSQTKNSQEVDSQNKNSQPSPTATIPKRRRRKVVLPKVADDLVTDDQPETHPCSDVALNKPAPKKARREMSLAGKVSVQNITPKKVAPQTTSNKKSLRPVTMKQRRNELTQPQTSDTIFYKDMRQRLVRQVKSEPLDGFFKVLSKRVTRRNVKAMTSQLGT